MKHLPVAISAGSRRCILAGENRTGEELEMHSTVRVAGFAVAQSSPDPSKRGSRSKSVVVAGLVLFVATSLFAPSRSAVISQAADTQGDIAAPVEGVSAKGGTASLQQVEALLARLPARIEKNSGQADPSIPYLGRARGYSFSLMEDKILLAASGRKASPGHEASRRSEMPGPLPEEKTDQQGYRTVFGIGLEGKNPDSALVPESPQQGITNYLKGEDPSSSQVGITGYSALRYIEVYPGVDLVVQDDSGLLSYRFYIKEGGDPSSIRLVLEGQEAVEIDEQGRLHQRTPYGELLHTAPYAYQVAGDEKVEVASSFVLYGEDVVGFSLGDYDPAAPLVIDPTLAWSSFLGGTGGDSANSIAVDSEGAVYLTGWTDSLDFPTMPGAYDDSYNGNTDVFVGKLSSDGSSLVYVTYVGGAEYEIGRSVAVDSSGAVYLTGETYSSDFPVTQGAFDTTYEGNGDTFVAKLSSDGSSLEYSAFLGGTDYESGYSITVDSSGAAYLTGQTWSDDFPVSSGAFQSAYVDFGDAFVSRVSPDGSSLGFSTYLGGSDYDLGDGIAIDASGAAYVSGGTYSANFPTTAGAYDESYNDFGDAFVTKLSAGGSSLEYSTYVGGSDYDWSYSVEVDSNGSAWVTGESNSGDFPTTAGAYDDTYDGSGDVIVARLSPDGSSLEYSTYVGGMGYEWAYEIGVDEFGSIYIAGGTWSPDFPTTPDGYDTSSNGNSDAFVSKLSADGTSLAYSTFLGGADYDWATGMALDTAGSVFLTGETWSSDFPTTSGVYDTSYDGNGDAFVTKISAAAPTTTISGTFSGGQFGAIAVFDTTGSLVAYQCCIYDPSGAWEVVVPAPADCSTSGYKVLFIRANDTQRTAWYDLKDNFSSAECVPAPSAGIDMDVSGPGIIQGYVKRASDATDIDGAIVYAYTSTGAFAGWTRSGYAGPGRYSMTLDPTKSYKLYVASTTDTLEDIWWSGAPGFAEATALAPPSTANFSLREAALIQGHAMYLGGDLPGAYISVFDACGCKTPKNGLSDSSGNFAIKVATTAASGVQYKVRVIPPSGSGTTKWYSSSSVFGSTNFAGGTAIDSPTSGIHIDTG